MKQHANTSLKTEIEKGQFLITVCVLLTCGLGFLVNNYINAKNNADHVVESTAYVLGQNLVSPLMFLDSKVAENVLRSVENHTLINGAMVYDLKGKLFASFPSDELQRVKELSLKTYEYPIISNGERVGSLTLSVHGEVNYFEMMGYVVVGIIVFGVAFVVAKTVTRLTSNKIITEISMLLSVIRKITQTGDFKNKALEGSKNKNQIEEIAGLSAEFDWMLSVIESRNQSIEEINQGLEHAVENKTRELRETQAGLVQSSKMSALGEMAAGLAHEINNPLAIISGKSQQIKNMIERNKFDKDQLVKISTSIQSTTERIAKIIKGLRSFSRDGSQDPMEICKLKTIIDETLEFCQNRFKSHEVALEVAPFKDDIEISCRSTQLGQVILNLLNNAHDAVYETQEKWVKLEVSVDDADWVTISVTDSGKGIPEKIRQKIMQPFFTTKEQGKGTGLGLSISKGIVESHSGSLTIDTACQNTRFVVRIPRAQAQTAPVQLKAA